MSDGQEYTPHTPTGEISQPGWGDGERDKGGGQGRWWQK